MPSGMLRSAELAAGQIVSSRKEIHRIPVIGKLRIQVLLDHADALICLHRAALRFFGLFQNVALEIELLAGLPDFLGLRPELRTKGVIKVPGFLLLLLLHLNDPETAVPGDVAQIAAFTIDRSDDDALARMALHHLAIARTILII